MHGSNLRKEKIEGKKKDHRANSQLKSKLKQKLKQLNGLQVDFML